MAFYGNKFRRLLETLIQSEGQTKIGKRLGSKFVITCNPELIQKLYDDPQITRSSISRRMTSQYGAGEFSVSQPLDRSRIKRQELKAFLNNPMYHYLLQTYLLLPLERLEPFGTFQSLCSSCQYSIFSIVLFSECKSCIPST